MLSCLNYSQRVLLIRSNMCISQALLDGELALSKGTIDLPLLPDYINRPMQMVHEKGKPARTSYDVIEVKNNMTRVHFYPITVSLSLCCSYLITQSTSHPLFFFTIGAHASAPNSCSTFSRIRLFDCW